MDKGDTAVQHERDDAAEIQAMIDAAKPGDTVTLKPGTYTLARALRIPLDVDLAGEGVIFQVPPRA